MANSCLSGITFLKFNLSKTGNIFGENGNTNFTKREFILDFQRGKTFAFENELKRLQNANKQG